jgi:hypothetical protein
VKITYADLRGPQQLERRILASKDFSTLKRWLLVQVVRQLAALDKRPLNWMNEVEINLDFDLKLRARMVKENLNYVNVEVMLQDIFVDWKVSISELPVGRFPFDFVLNPGYRPCAQVLEPPTVDLDVVFR